ncbi:hypothetical protein [Streptosporangium sp. CA-115845]|uniref:hypothetical protein n=1 Tax=Streptosporangium sp. CA-115845 TaxID=3240071 RepID=UPI003D92E290
MPPIRTTSRLDPLTLGAAGIVGASTVILSFTALAGLGALAGWTKTIGLFGAELAQAWLLPVCVDVYGAAATRITVDQRYSDETRRHALVHAAAALVVSIAGNATFHLLEAEVLHLGGGLWILVVSISVVPPVALGALAHLIAMCARDIAVPAEVRAPGTVPGAVPAEVRQVSAVPAEAASVAADLWPGLLENLELPDDDPDPYPPRGGGVPAAAPAVPGRVRPRPTAVPEGFAPVPDRFASVPAATNAQASGVPEDVPEPRELYLRALQTYVPDGELTGLPPVRQVKRELKCGQDRAQEVRDYLAGYAALRTG